jgi:hypothetical protein
MAADTPGRKATALQDADFRSSFGQLYGEVRLVLEELPTYILMRSVNTATNIARIY